MSFPFDEVTLRGKVATAVRFFWKVRRQQGLRQRQRGPADAGTRGQVTGGKQMDGFAKIIREVALAAGYEKSEIFFNTAVPIPGYYRPQKNWDVVILRDGRLIALIELKSQCGSFSNNFNNRAEEVIGVSRDFWLAYRERAFGVSVSPWIGYFLFVKRCEESLKPVGLTRSPLAPLTVFADTGYLRRYELLCERLVLERDFTSTALVVSDDAGREVGDGGPNVTAMGFLKSLYAHLVASA